VFSLYSILSYYSNSLARELGSRAGVFECFASTKSRREVFLLRAIVDARDLVALLAVAIDSNFEVLQRGFADRCRAMITES
jgi:hypothetical protein